MSNVIDYFETWHRDRPDLLELAMRQTQGNVELARMILWRGMLENKRIGGPQVATIYEAANG